VIPLKIITLIDGVKVYLPDSLNLISSYVLEEQLDWFEDEIKFIRKIIQKNQHIIDIGANYGVYTLSLANLVGNYGKVYAFEPSNETAEILLKSLQINCFKNIVVEKKALSKEIGVANLSLNKNSELNSLERNNLDSELTELVKITTLDESMKLFQWKKIDFIKIDAEGEEENIIQGGLKFFTLNSPLVMFEIKVGNKFNLKIIDKFDSLKYKTFKLIPGLNILAPFKKNEVIDAYSLNLFCCKPDRSNLLREQGYLVNDEDDYSDENSPLKYSLEIKARQISFNSQYILRLPYTKYLQEEWLLNLSKFDPLLMKSLNLYYFSKNTLIAKEKYHCLLQAYNYMHSLCKLNCSNLRLSTLARIAIELGNRAEAVRALNILTKNIMINKKIEISEPFLLPSDDFENINPKNNILNFIWSSLLTSLEKTEYFSSYYSGKSTQGRIDAIIKTDFYNDEIIRRRDLILKRYENLF